MNGNPAITLFGDGGSVQVNTSALHRAEEKEALEDQIRHNEELAREIDRGFDDLTDEEDQNDTVNSLSYSEAPQPPLPTVNRKQNQRVLDGLDNKILPTGGGGDNHHIQQWQKLYESRSREFEHVTKLLHERSKEYEVQINDLKKRLLLMESERDRANMTRTQTHGLLVDSKTKISEQEDTITKLKSKIKTLEEINLKLEAELEHKKTMLQDTLHKYQMVEQNIGVKADRHTDQLLKQAEEKHSAKVAMMQQQINNLRSDLDDQQQEVRRFEVRYKELQSMRDALLIEKTETVQRLQNCLEESQHKIETLMTQTLNLNSLTQDNLRLKSKLTAMEQQTNDMQRTINTLTHRLETTNAELEVMDSVLCQNESHNATEVDSSCTFAATRKNLVGSTPINPISKIPEDRITKLKRELLTCMNGLKEKRDTIKRLEIELKAKDKEIQQLKEDESAALVQMNQYKEEAFRVSSKVKILENELEKYQKQEQAHSKQSRRSSYDRQHTMDEKIFALQHDKMQLEEKLSKLEHEYDLLDNKYKNMSTATQVVDDVKLELEKQKFLLKDSQKECERLKNLYIEISNSKDAICRELATLKSQDSAKEISLLNDKVVSLERALQLAELKSSELSKLLDKEKTEHEHLLREIQDNHDHIREVKQNKQSSNSCTKCINHLAEISKLEIQNLQFQNSCASYLREINDLKEALRDSNTVVRELHEKLNLKAERDQLIDELKEKAAQFEVFMRNQHSSNNTANSSGSNQDHTPSSHPPAEPHRRSRDQSVSTSPELQEIIEAESRKQAREQEHRIREDMARAFAVEMKVIEEKFKAQFLKFEENITALKDELHDRVSELLIRNKEVEVLKYAITNEREKMTELLAKRDEDAKALFDKQAEVMKKYKAEAENCQRKVQFLESELEEKRELIQSERESMEKLIKQITEERKMFHERELEVIEKFKEIEKEYGKSLEMVTEKYNSVKKTALNYKKYAEDKEQHMLKEYDRIKEAYNVALLKVQNRMKEAIESKDRSMKERLANMEAEYQSKLNMMKMSS